MAFASLAFLWGFACATALIADDAQEKYDDTWVQTYYQHPKPELFESEVAKMQAAGVLSLKDAMPPTASFFSRLFADASSSQLSQWLKTIKQLPKEDQKVFLVALHLADTNDSKAALRECASKDDELSPIAQKLLDSKTLKLSEISNPSPGDLDMCWGAFFATGDKAYVLPIIRCAVRPEQPRTIDLSKRAAGWSLKSLSNDQKRVREIKDEFYKSATPEEQASLDELFKN
jgi:hypothetical protein